MTDERTVVLEVADGVARLTLNRPDRLNAYTARMGRELTEAFRHADADDAVRVVIVTGAGRGFCAGADISSGAEKAAPRDPGRERGGGSEKERERERGRGRERRRTWP